MPYVFRPSLLWECHRPFVLPRPATAPTSTTERELSLANAVGQLDASDRDRRVRERLEPGHRRAASLDGPESMTCEDEIRVAREKHHVSTGTLGTQIKPTPRVAEQSRGGWPPRWGSGPRGAESELALVGDRSRAHRCALGCIPVARVGDAQRKQAVDSLRRAKG
jgi:hypothetical protein